MSIPYCYQGGAHIPPLLDDIRTLGPGGGGGGVGWGSLTSSWLWGKCTQGLWPAHILKPVGVSVGFARSSFCDLLLQVLFCADLGNGKTVEHICEIQIHLGALPVSPTPLFDAARTQHALVYTQLFA